MARPDPLKAVAADLYALPLAEFTRARNSRATDARAAGDRELADRIRSLKKPSASAWAVNMLARHRAKEVSQLLELGASLREAQQELDADELRRLGRERQKLIAAVVRSARALAKELGGPIGDAAAAEVGETLQAALADADASRAVLGGALTGPLTASGWGTVDLSDAVAVTVGPRPAAKVTSMAERRVAKAREAVDQARQNLEQRREEAKAVTDRLAELEPERDGLTKQLDELKARIAELQDDLGAVEREMSSLSRAQRKASVAVDDAEAELEDARGRLDRLT